MISCEKVAHLNTDCACLPVGRELGVRNIKRKIRNERRGEGTR